MSKSIFSYNSDINKNAYLNWRTEVGNQTYNLYVLGDSFADAACLMMDAILQNNTDKKADSLIMPIFHSIDQSIELYMKAIIRLIEILEGSKPTNQTSHDIEMMKNSMLSSIKKHKIKTKGLEKALKPVTDYISELYEKIKIINEKGKPEIKIDFARYPIDTEGKPHFYIAALENVVVDIENLKERYSKVRDSLCGIYYMLEAEQEDGQ